MNILVAILMMYVLILTLIVVLFSAVITYFTKTHPVIVILLSMASGYIFSMVVEIPDLAFPAIILTGCLSVFVTIIVKIARKAEREATTEQKNV